MILEKQSDVQLLVNGTACDLSKDFDLNLNSKVYDPESILSKTADYSYSFSLPTTPNNCKIFGYSNILSVVGKFSRTYEAELNVDGSIAFSGKLRISEVSKNEFKCNLLVIKVNTVEDIFGDATLDMVDWKVDFDGIPTINEVNNDRETKYYFPLVSYGVFAKNPMYKYNTFNDYTSIYSIDYTNKFYYTTFYPSVNVMELVKKCFESKGYSVDGSAFHDTVFDNLYMSTNLSAEQQPIYNLGHEDFGSCSLKTELKNYYKYNKRGDTIYPVAEGTLLDLEYPYSIYHADGKYNFDRVHSYNMLSPSKYASRMSKGSQVSVNVTSNTENYMYSDDDGAITIPSDGLYAIHLDVNATVKTENTYINASSMTVRQNYAADGNWLLGDDKVAEITIKTPNDGGWNYRDFKPIEVQLVRNYENDLELIKGSKSWYHPNVPNATNGVEVNSAYPHEDTKRIETSAMGRKYTVYPTKPMEFSNPETNDVYYFTNDNELFLYDPMINPNFICGFSTIGRCPSVIKNGYSWYKGNTSSTDARVNSNGYFVYDYNNDNTYRSNYHIDTLTDAPAITYTCDANGVHMVGSIDMMIYLNKNDRLTLHTLLRNYETKSATREGAWVDSTYPVDVTCNLSIKAMSPSHSDTYFANGNTYISPTEFDSKLNLGNFLNNEMTMSDFVNDVIKSFNLEYKQNGNSVTLDIQKTTKTDNTNYAINIDDRVNTANTEISISRIEYPSSLAVKYAISTKEAGFYDSVPRAHINDPDWEDYGEKGYDVIQLDNTGDENSQEVSLKNSYCWYEDFTISIPTYDVSGNVTDSASSVVNVSIPIIAESQYFIDRGDVEEYMTKDGYSLNYRFWFRDWNNYATMRTVYDRNDSKNVNIYIPKGNLDGLYLDYHSFNNNLLKKYFNIMQSTESNYIDVDCYLTTDEYIKLKNGADVVLDSDLYNVCEIKKFSVKKKNKANLKLMKK